MQKKQERTQEDCFGQMVTKGVGQDQMAAAKDWVTRRTEVSNSSPIIMMTLGCIHLDWSYQNWNRKYKQANS